MDSEKQIQELKKKIEMAKDTRYRAEARLDQLEREKQQYLEELKKLKVQPEDLDDEIEKLSLQIQQLIAEAKELIPDDL